MVFCEWLILFNIIFSRFIHVIACINTSFLFVTKHYSLVWTEYILFVHLQAVICFHFELFWMMLLGMFMYMFCIHMFPNLLDIQQAVEPPNYLVTPCLAFWGTIKLFFKAAASFMFPPGMEESCNFSTSLSTHAIAHLSDYSYPSGFEVRAHYGFDLHFCDG